MAKPEVGLLNWQLTTVIFKRLEGTPEALNKVVVVTPEVEFGSAFKVTLASVML